MYGLFKVYLFPSRWKYGGGQPHTTERSRRMKHGSGHLFGRGKGRCGPRTVKGPSFADQLSAGTCEYRHNDTGSGTYNQVKVCGPLAA
jgi:hypothetical protein